MTILNMHSLPQDDNINRFTYCSEIDGEMFIQKGAMIAYYGSLYFEAIGADILDILVKDAFNSPKYINNFIVVNGRGKILIADKKRDIASYNLEDANLTIKAGNLLGFSPTLRCQESIVPGYLTLLGTGLVIASSNGPVHFLETPVRVDQDALIGWGDIPTPSYYYDYKHANSTLGGLAALTGLTLSGEEKQLSFNGEGTVLIQSSEM